MLVRALIIDLALVPALTQVRAQGHTLILSRSQSLPPPPLHILLLIQVQPHLLALLRVLDRSMMPPISNVLFATLIDSVIQFLAPLPQLLLMVMP